VTPEARLIQGDCLVRIPELCRKRSERFDLIYADPPFNAGGTRRARKAGGPRSAGAHAYTDAWGGIDAFVAMLEPRLAAMRAALRDNGSLWLHLDHRTVHEAKLIGDRVFGRAAFQGEIIWVPGNGARRRTGPSITHQTILIFSTGEMCWNDDEPALREPYAATSVAMHFQNVDADGRAFRERTINGKTYRYYRDAGRRIGSVWTDCPAMLANTPLNPETTGYPTQKPEKLLERIILASTKPGARVLDPMCGSGTTLAVARRLGRNAFGIDQSPLACEITRARLGRSKSRAHAERAGRR
jgi:site-specific DNA-methyltransferase (adenine-specific)